MGNFFEKKVTKVSRKSLYFLIFTFGLLIVLMLVQVIFLGILGGDRSMTWILVPANNISNLILWIFSGIVLMIDFVTTIFIFVWLIKKVRNPFIYKTNFYPLIWVFLVFILNILIPNLIPINYMFPVIAIVTTSTSIVIL